MYSVSLYCPSCNAYYQALGPNALTLPCTCRFCGSLLEEGGLSVLEEGGLSAEEASEDQGRDELRLVQSPLTDALPTPDSGRQSR